MESCPSTIGIYAAQDPKGLAAWLILLERLPLNTCVLPFSGRVVTLWQGPMHPPVDEADIDQLIWDHGAISGLAVKPASCYPDIMIGSASCKTSVMSGLNSNFGKGFSANTARITTIGECLERIAAARGPALDTTALTPKYQFTLEDFHPFGEEWEGSKDKLAAHACKYVPAKAMVSNQVVSVPAELIPFPLLADRHGNRLTKSDTCGLAIYPTFSGAVVRGCLEVLERDDLYPHLLQMRNGVRIEGDFSRVIKARLIGLQIDLISFERSHSIVIIHCFLTMPGCMLVARGSGSGFCYSEAVDKALAEAVQVLEFGRENLSQMAPSSVYSTWASSTFRAFLTSYLASMPIRVVAADNDLKLPNDDEQLAEILSTLKDATKELIVCELLSPVNNWTAVRVLIPGAACHQNESSSKGGQRIANRIFPYSILN